MTGFTVPFTINTDYFSSLMASAFSNSRAPPQFCHFLDNYELQSRLPSYLLLTQITFGLKALGSLPDRYCYSCVCQTTNKLSLSGFYLWSRLTGCTVLNRAENSSIVPFQTVHIHQPTVTTVVFCSI